jgi:small-conductance mechanosensitive channel
MWVATGIGAAADTVQAPQADLPLPPEQVVTHVTRSIAWYRSIVALQQLPVDSDDVVPRDRLSQTALKSLQLAFDFGHAAGALAGKAPDGKVAPAPSPANATGSTGKAAPPTPNTTASPGDSANSPAASPGSGGATKASSPADTSGPENSQGQAGDIDRAVVRLEDRASSLQSQLSSLDAQIAHAAPKDKDTLVAQRGEVSAALDLTKEMQGTVGQLQKFEESSDSRASGASGGLAAQIADLQKTVPEIRQVSSKSRGSAGCAGGNHASNGGDGNSGKGSNGGTANPSTDCTNSGAATPTPASANAAAPAAPAPAPGAETFRPESAGVIALLGKWFSLEGARRQLSDATKQTDALTKELDGVRSAVTQQVRVLARQNLDAPSTDPAQIAQARLQFETASIRFKQLSTLLIPVGEQGISVESARNILSTWHDSLAARNATVTRYLALRLGFLLGSVAVVLVVSEVWRRATFRYLKDSRRRQQFLALRRVAVGLALTVVIVFGLVSEVGSLATYAGLITAGLAVALQNVILAVVAYFFLIGRYGVRVGDRITLAGVTGRVVEIGLVRIYLMELTGPELRSSGRMVVLSNAVLFQPTALFKQMPGGEYFWHTILLTVAPTSDVSAAEKRLNEAADSIYENYRPAIEQQHAALQRFIDFETAMPKPEVYARLTDKGLECTVRYPVEPARAASIDQKMLTALREAQSKAPPLELVSGPLLMTTDT